MSTTHDRYQEMLGEMLDGALAEAERSRLIGHLSTCGECRLELEAITSLREEARSLPRGIAPPRDLWTGIAARIGERESAAPVITLESRRRSPVVWRQWAPLAAAAVLLVVMSSGLTVVLMRAPAIPITTAAVPAAGTQARPTTALAAFRPAEVEFQNTVAALEAELEARRDALSPETVATIEANLAIIDQAIAEAKAALEADPSSANLSRHLSGVYRQKVDLLGSAVKIAT